MAEALAVVKVGNSECGLAKLTPVSRNCAMAGAVYLAPLGIAPWALGFAGPLYGATAAVTGVIMVVLAWQVFCERRPAERASKQLFAFSILYLFLLFAVLLVERGWGGLLARLAA